VAWLDISGRQRQLQGKKMNVPLFFSKRRPKEFPLMKKPRDELRKALLRKRDAA